MHMIMMQYHKMDLNILLSLINTKLRDNYDNLEDLCEDLDYDIDDLNQKLNSINYYYDEKINQFISK